MRPSNSKVINRIRLILIFVPSAFSPLIRLYFPILFHICTLFIINISLFDSDVFRIDVQIKLLYSGRLLFLLVPVRRENIIPINFLASSSPHRELILLLIQLYRIVVFFFGDVYL